MLSDDDMRGATPPAISERWCGVGYLHMAHPYRENDWDFRCSGNRVEHDREVAEAAAKQALAGARDVWSSDPADADEYEIHEWLDRCVNTGRGVPFRAASISTDKKEG